MSEDEFDTVEIQVVDDFLDFFNQHTYQTVDIPMFKGALALDVVVSLMKQEGWDPIALIPAHEEYPHDSVVFWKEVGVSDE